VVKARQPSTVNRQLSLHLLISFNIQPVHIQVFNFLDAGLREGIILNHDRKGEIMSFPGAVIAKLQVFCIGAVL